ncbi:unnamed protein product, partial [Sphagnum jensenii]
MTLIFAQSLFFLSSAVPFVCCLLLCFFPLVGCWVLLYSHPPSPFLKPTHPPTHKKLHHFHLQSSFHCTCYLLHSISQTPCVLAGSAWYFFGCSAFLFLWWWSCFFFFFRLFVCCCSANFLTFVVGFISVSAL